MAQDHWLHGFNYNVEERGALERLAGHGPVTSRGVQ
jgi:hypothetical protein